MINQGPSRGVSSFVQGHILLAVQEYTRLLTVLLRDTNKTVPQILSENRGILSDMTVIASGGGGVFVAGKLWVASLGVWKGSVLLPLGFASMPLWVPITGGLIGVSAAVVGLRFIVAKLEADERLSIFRLAYHCNHLMMRADRRLSSTEKDLLEDIVIRSGLDQAVLEEIESEVPKTIRQLDVQKDISAENRYAVLVGCWQIALCDGIHPTEDRVFRKLCLKLGLSEKIDEIKSEAEQTSEHNARLWEAVAIAARGIAGSELMLSEAMMRSLIALNPREDARERMRQAGRVGSTVVASGASIAALVTGRPELLRVILQGYTMSLGFLAAPGHKSVEEMRENALQIADSLQIPRPKAEKALKQIEKGISVAIEDVTNRAPGDRSLT